MKRTASLPQRPAIILILMLVMIFGKGGQSMALELKSSAFGNGRYIPQKHTGQGPDISPSLQWSGVPDKTASFVLICSDPDAPAGDWTHWLIYDIPAFTTSLEEYVLPKPILGDGIKQGKNDFGKIGYAGPMPPPGKPHKYVFKLYALDAVLGKSEALSRKQLESAMAGHIIEAAELIGLYKR